MSTTSTMATINTLIPAVAATGRPSTVNKQIVHHPQMQRKVIVTAWIMNVVEVYVNDCIKHKNHPCSINVKSQIVASVYLVYK